jgi:hypothetical protein
MLKKCRIRKNDDPETERIVDEKQAEAYVQTGFEIVEVLEESTPDPTGDSQAVDVPTASAGGASPTPGQ